MLDNFEKLILFLCFLLFILFCLVLANCSNWMEQHKDPVVTTMPVPECPPPPECKCQ